MRSRPDATEARPAAGRHVAVAPRAPSRRRAAVLDGVLVLAALCGLLVVLWRVAAAAAGLELVTFATGSMTPAFPQGAVAVAQAVPLADVRPGDVVTVDRGPHRLPITHRVVSIRLIGDGAVVRLRGDANRDPDPSAYRVAALHRIVVRVPPAAQPVLLLATPLGAAGGAAVAALAIAWAMWPQRRASGRDARDSRTEEAAAAAR